MAASRNINMVDPAGGAWRANNLYRKNGARGVLAAVPGVSGIYSAATPLPVILGDIAARAGE